MAGDSKADLPVDLGLIATPDLKPLAAAKAGGTEEDKVPMGNLDELKDQAASENSIPLSPQWLYAKTGDNKVALSVAPGDTRSASFLTQGTLVDSSQRDAWRPEGPHDKKEWRRNVPDVENSRRWHDEERETGLLGRRERRKDGDRENEYRKSDRRSENVSMRDTADSRSLPSPDRWHEVPNRNSGYDSRRDSKWSSRWGPEDKEKDSRLEKRTDGDKDDTHVEKQSVIGGSRPLPESDSRDKWKPRHRQETHSSGTAVYRAAPGFGVERGRIEGPVVGFAPGRGRSNSVGNLPFCGGSSSTVPLGAVPSILNGSLLGKCSLSADTFRYPRGKILDIYRKNKMLSPFDSTHEGFVEVHQLTESSSIPPLAFVKPDSEEVDVLEDIWKGKVTSSDPQMEKMDTGSVCEIATTDDGECKDKISAMFNGKDLGVITSTVSKGGVFSNGPGCLVQNNDGSVQLPDFLDDSKFAALESTPLDTFTKLPGDSNSLFSASLIQEIPGSDSQHPDSTKRELVHQASELFYQDPQGETQGPFLTVDILSWYDQGFFGADLPVRLSDAPEGTDFQTLGDLIPNLSLRPQFPSLVNPNEKTAQLDTTGGNLEATSPASEFSNPLTLTDRQLQSSESDVPIGQQAQPRVSPPEASSHFQMPQVSHPEISGGIVDGRQNFFDISGQDAEEVLYMGRPGNSIQNPSGKLSYDIHDLSRTSNGNQYPQTGQVNFTNYNTPTDDDSNPLGLSWSELEGAHHKGPLSSITSGVGNRGHNINPLLGGDASLFRHNQEQFGIKNDSVVRDSWSGNNRRNTSSNILHDAFEPEINNFNIEDSLLSQKFQMQQHLMSSHQNMQLSGSYLEQLHPLRQQQAMLYREHMLKLEIQRQQHLQQLEEEEQLRQQQLHRQMQQLQQQHEQQQQQQLLIEQLLHHKFRERNFGVPHVDPLRGEILYRQHLLRELQQQAHHLPLDHEPSLDQLMQAKLGHNRLLEHHNELLDAPTHPSHRRMLPLEQQYLLDLQQEQIQSRQFPISSRHQPGMDEERHVGGGAWSIDESGQFIRAPTGQHHSRSGRPSQLDFVQPLQRTSSFEQPAHLDRNFLLHDRIQQGNFGLNSPSLERSASTPRPDMDLINVYACLQGMDVQDNYGRSSQMGQLSGNRSQQNWMPNQHPNLHLDVMERNWSEPNGQLQNNLIESQFAQFHLAEKQKREMQADLSFEDWSRRSSLVGNNEMPNNVPADLLRQKLLQSSQALGVVDGALTSSYEKRDPSWLFSQHATDDSTIFNVDNTSFGESSMEGSLFARLGQTNQMRSANLNSEGLADSFFESSRRLPFRSSSGASSEHKQFFADNEAENYQLAHPMGGIEQSEPSVIDHDALRNKGPARHSSFGVTGGGTNLYNYDMGPDNAYVDLVPNDRASGNLPVSDSRNDMTRFRRTSSYNDTDAAPEASFMDMLKGTRKQTPAETEGCADPSDGAGSGGKMNKKKGKKGRQIDPSLLGFKVHSNRIMMGEIQRPE